LTNLMKSSIMKVKRNDLYKSRMAKKAGEKGMSSETEKQERRESVRLDETVKLLFEVSKETLVKTINSLFHEDFAADSVEIDKTATEYPTNELDIIRADIFIKITQYKPRHFHIEVETEPSRTIAVRTFEYDIMKAIGNWR